MKLFGYKKNNYNLCKVLFFKHQLFTFQTFYNQLKTQKTSWKRKPTPMMKRLMLH